MKLKAQNSFRTFVYWDTKFFQKVLSRLIIQKFIGKLINFYDFASQNPEISIRYVSSPFKVEYFPLLFYFH